MQSEDIRRKLDLSVYGSYEELYKKVGHMFDVESAEAMSNVICKDQTGETKYPGDKPFSEFLKTPKTFMIPTYDAQRCAVLEVGISDVQEEVLLVGKADVVHSFEKNGSLMVMVGDEINDSSTLVAADVGIAIGAGTDIDIEAAVTVLMRNNLEDIITVIDLSRKTFQRIRWNYIFAMGYNVITVSIAVGVFYRSMIYL